MKEYDIEDIVVIKMVLLEEARSTLKEVGFTEGRDFDTLRLDLAKKMLLDRYKLDW